MSDDEELMEISFEPAHAAGCNYYLRPLGSPGCICAVVSRKELDDLCSQLAAYKAKLAKTNEELESAIKRAGDHCLDAEIYRRKLEGADANWAEAVSQLAAEREKRAALVREWRASDGDHYYLAGLEFCADQLEALDKEANDV